MSHPSACSVTPALIAQLAADYGTPFWLYDAATIEARLSRLVGFDVVRYAQKANPNLHLLRLLKSLGACVDAVSLGEIERAHRAGFRNRRGPNGKHHDEIVYTSDVIDAATIRRVIELDIPVNAGSPQMLDQLGQAAPGHRVWLRINPGFGHGHSKKTNTGGESSKHGNWHATMEECYERIRRHGLQLVGLHMHIGSGVDEDHLRRVCGAMVEQARRCPVDIRAISTGGGMPVRYRDGEREFDAARFYAVWHETRQELERHFGHAITLETEPGRYLVAESGCLVSEVRAVKEVGSRHFVLVNAGFTELVRPAMYGSHHRISTLDARGNPGSGALRPTVVAGPLCEAGDVFTQDSEANVVPRDLPAMQPGDLLVLHEAGAYGASMSSTYNSRPLAPELLLQDGAVRLIRRRQSWDELLQLEDC
jgi:diaminopimelate decarboxylase